MSGANSGTVLITGASSGIGWELAKCFAADGSRLILTARNTEALQTLADELHRNHNVEVTVLTADLSLPESPERIFKELQGRGIAVDVLVNNAGFGAWGRFAGLPLQRQLEMLQVNVTALVELTGLFLPGMVQRRRGGILNVASVAGFVPGPGMAV
jgi:short-subunit dehydrogenase